MNNAKLIPVTPFNMNVITLNPTINFVNPNDTKSKAPLIEYSVVLFGLPILAFDIYGLCESIIKVLLNTFKYMLSDFRFVIYETIVDSRSIKKVYVINPYKISVIDHIPITQVDRIDIQFMTYMSMPDVSSFTYNYDTGTIKPIIIKSGD